MRALATALMLSGCAEAIADVQHHEVVLETSRVHAIGLARETTAERARVALRDGRTLELAGVRLQRDGQALAITAVDHAPWRGSIEDVAGLELQQVRIALDRTRVQADDSGPTIVALLGVLAGGVLTIAAIIAGFE